MQSEGESASAARCNRKAVAFRDKSGQGDKAQPPHGVSTNRRSARSAPVRALFDCGLRIAEFKSHALMGVNTKDDRFGARPCGSGFSTGAGKDKQTPYGATTNHENF